MPDDRRVLEGVTRLVVDGTNVLYALRRGAGAGGAGNPGTAAPGPLPAAALVGRLRAIVPTGVSVIVVLDGSPEHGLVARQVASGVEVRYAGRATADNAIVRLVEQEFAGSDGTLVITDDIELGNQVRRAGGRTARNGWLLSRLDRQLVSAPSRGGNTRASGPASAFGATGAAGSSPARHTAAQPAKHPLTDRAAHAGAGSPRAAANADPGHEAGDRHHLGGQSFGRPTGIGGGRIPRSAADSPSGGNPAVDDADEARRWAPGRGATRKRGNAKRRPMTGR